MKYLVTFVMILSVMAFAGDKKDHAHAGMDKTEKMSCTVADGEACAGIKLSSAACACGNTEKVIGSALNGVDGVTLAQVDMKNQMAHVHYKTASVKPAKLEKAVTAVGFDANDTKRDKKAYSELPACCQADKKM